MEHANLTRYLDTIFITKEEDIKSILCRWKSYLITTDEPEEKKNEKSESYWKQICDIIKDQIIILTLTPIRNITLQKIHTVEFLDEFSKWFDMFITHNEQFALYYDIIQMEKEKQSKNKLIFGNELLSTMTKKKESPKMISLDNIPIKNIEKHKTKEKMGIKKNGGIPPKKSFNKNNNYKQWKNKPPNHKPLTNQNNKPFINQNNKPFINQNNNPFMNPPNYGYNPQYNNMQHNMSNVPMNTMYNPQPQYAQSPYIPNGNMYIPQQYNVPMSNYGMPMNNMYNQPYNNMNMPMQYMNMIQRINKVYIIDLENRHENIGISDKNNAFRNDSLYIGFRRIQSRLNHLFSTWQECMTDDIIQEYNKCGCNKLIFTKDGALEGERPMKEYIDHYITSKMEKFMNDLKNYGFTGTIYLISKDNSMLCTYHITQEQLVKKGMAGYVNIEINYTI